MISKTKAEVGRFKVTTQTDYQFGFYFRLTKPMMHTSLP